MKRSILILTLALMATAIQAQTSGFGISLKAYDPKAAFNTNVDKTAFGLSMSYFYTPEASRFTFGGEFGVAMYSSDQYDITFQGRRITIEEEDCFFTLHGFARYDMVKKRSFSLYSEARVGVTTFFSTTDAMFENTGFDGEFEFHGTAFNMGAGVGIMVNPVALFDKEREASGLWLDFAINGHSGSNTSYRMHPEGQGTFSLEDGKYESLTHYIGYRVGVIFGI
ncbi:MAG: hypothetical protein Roseis2KO_32200 [Roseivirga sp.]